MADCLRSAYVRLGKASSTITKIELIIDTLAISPVALVLVGSLVAGLVQHSGS